jgi:hypothetical protein
MKTFIRRLCLSLLDRLHQTPALLAALALAASPASTQASIAYGSINNFDTVNDTGRVCHGFEIEIEDCHTTAITYTYNYNHYGVPKITQDDSIPGHPKTVIRWESKKNADGSWAAHTAIPTTTIAPTDGHQFTNPSVNFGGEHFGVGYNISVGAIHYNWLVDNGSGALVHGGVVQVSTPVFTYYPPVAAAPAQVQAVIVPPPPPAPEPKEFGKAVWMKEIKTTTHNSNEIKLRELVSDDPDDANDKNWANGEPDEVEVEWRLLQKRNTQPDGGPNNEVAAAPEDLPNGDEVVTRRYEFFKYTGPVDAETGEAMADAVDADGVHGSGTVTYADHFNPATGEWQTITTDLSTLEVVGDYTGAQMAAVDVDAPVGLIDHVGEAEVGTAYAPRTVVIEGALPFTATQTGSLPPGMTFDEVTGVLSGTPATAGVYAFDVTASDGYNVDVEKKYTMTVTAAGAEPAPASLLDTSCSPVGSGTTTGDGSYAIGANATVTATAEPGYHFLNWTDNGLIVGTNTSYSLAMDVNHSLVANFAPDVVQWNITTSAAPVEGGTTTGDGLVDDGLTTTVTATANAGYVFSNWTEGVNIVSTSSSYTFTATTDRSLVANFTQSPSFSVTTTSAPLAGGSTTGGGSYASGSSVTVTAVPNVGYAFVNWTEGAAQVSASASYTFTVSASRSLVANFALIGGPQYVITTAASPLAGGTLTGAGSYSSGTSVTVTATAAPGYMFSRWKENGASVSSSASYTFTATADRGLTATFIEAYTVTLLSSPPSGGSTEADSISYKLDENARVEAFPNSGYQFVNWTENGAAVSSSNPYNFNVTGSRTLVANFAVIGGVSISASAAPVAGGTVTGGGSVVSGTPVTLTATPSAGYGFINWTENGTEVSTSPGYSFTANASRTLVANFAAGSTLSTSSNPSIGGSTSGGGFVPAGNSVTLVAKASPGYTFLHWTDATGTEVGTSASHTFTPAADGEYVAHFLAPAIGVHFDFDTSTPVPSPDDVDPLDQTAAGITATFSGAAPGDFKVTTETLGARTLSQFNGNHLESTVDGSTLTIQLSTPATGVSIDFATVENVGVGVASTLQLTAFDTSSGLPVVVGNAIAHGTVTAGDSLPVGTLTFNSGAGTFDQITLQLPDAPAGALRFLVDNLLVSPGSSTGGSLSLANPNWNITLTDFGYSDFLLDNTPGFEGREYLSGEWGSAVAYNRNGQENSPKWLEPNFLYPDWQTNSDFHVVEGIHVIGTNLDGLPIAQSVIASNDLEVTLRFEMVDTVTGTPMGVKPAGAAGEPLSVKSNRYVMNQTFTVKNISGTEITNLQLFHLLHGFISQRGQFDNRSYVGNLAEYQHDITMSGVDAGAAGAQSSSIGLEDLIGFHSKVAPSAFEIGHYGIENNGIDDHSLGKPSDGVHLSIEDNWTNAPYLGRKNRDSFAPADRWISGAQRWELGSLTPGQSVSFDIILSLLTGTKVVVDGGGTTGTGGHGSCNGGSSHAGGVDFEFEDIDQEGTFFGEYSEADDDEMLERENEGEFALPGFQTPNGTRRQRWNLKYNGSHTGAIKLKFAYNPALLPAGYDENQLCIYHFNNGVWEKLVGKVNPATNTIEAVTPSLSPFMLGVNDVIVKPDVTLSADAPGALNVSWPDSFTGWTLQENSDLSPAGWFNSTRPLSTVNGTTSVSVPISSGSRFFRLVKP